ncbi:exonuclease 3'-5' domain-containing protein 2-like isoform X2 [Armigeres subalbatus]|uniref:exonuclease 3'-5' domain-containing protein 2-like isoform X2 n=1 Tax=Armigeres subalbatus TaxID=124917 RepID=UPI002ED2FD82
MSDNPRRNEYLLMTLLGAGALFVAYQVYKHNMSSNVSAPNNSNRTKVILDINDVPYYNRPHMNRVISNQNECKQALKKLRQACKKYPVLGLDCEWNNDRNGRRKVALLQLATQTGLCFLFRLCKIGYIPEELKCILADPNIRKAGVGVETDMQYLLIDYQADGAGAVDLREMAEICDVPLPHDLASLAKQSLGIIMDKTWQVSDWEADVLTENQIKYAANDARVAIELYKVYDYNMK